MLRRLGTTCYFPLVTGSLMARPRGFDGRPVLLTEGPAEEAVLRALRHLDIGALNVVAHEADAALAEAVHALNRGVSRDDISEFLERHLPELVRLWELLPRTRAETYAFISLLVALMGLVLQQQERNDRALPPEHVRELVVLMRDSEACATSGLGSASSPTGGSPRLSDFPPGR